MLIPVPVIGFTEDAELLDVSLHGVGTGMIDDCVMVLDVSLQYIPPHELLLLLVTALPVGYEETEGEGDEVTVPLAVSDDKEDVLETPEEDVTLQKYPEHSVEVTGPPVPVISEDVLLLVIVVSGGASSEDVEDVELQ